MTVVMMLVTVTDMLMTMTAIVQMILWTMVLMRANVVKIKRTMRMAMKRQKEMKPEMHIKTKTTVQRKVKLHPVMLMALWL